MLESRVINGRPSATKARTEIGQENRTGSRTPPRGRGEDENEDEDRKERNVTETCCVVKGGVVFFMQGNARSYESILLRQVSNYWGPFGVGVMVACRRPSRLGSSRLGSSLLRSSRLGSSLRMSSIGCCLREGGGGRGPPGGAGRMGSENMGRPALCEPEGTGDRSWATTCWPYRGIELVVTTRDPSPGCTFDPPGRPATGPRVGDRVDTLPDWSRGDTKLPIMGISPEVGVCSVWVRKVGESLERKSSCVAGESCGARCDLRLSRSIKPQAHSLRSTGVRLAAWTKGSRSCFGYQYTAPAACKELRPTYKKLLGSWPLVGRLVQALLNHVVQNLRERVTLGQSRRGLVDNLLQEVENASRGTLSVR